MAGVRLYNALTRRVEPLAVRGSALHWYACGPTVYDDAHVGHARAYVTQDVARRVLERIGGVPVVLAQGVTDLDDKILKRARENGVAWRSLAADKEKSFWADMRVLGVRPPDIVLRVTEHVEEMICFTKRILERGKAYVAPDGSVYFDTRAIGARYGQLRNIQDAEHDTDDQPDNKRNPHDFALWKAAKEDDPADATWASPWSRGRPGWHIECSAMAHKVFGEHLDLHSGGIDLAFPHHENEIAQCEACFGRDGWCTCFIHFGHLHVRGQKMSKSLKNFTTIANMVAANGPQAGRIFRMFCLMSPYRSPAELTPDVMANAAALDARINAFLATSRDLIDRSWEAPALSPAADALRERVVNARGRIREALLDDLDTAGALKVALDVIGEANRHTGATFPSVSAVAGATAVVDDFCDAVGLRYERAAAGVDVLDELVTFRAKVRREAVQASGITRGALFRACDEVRDRVAATTGITIKDLPDGTSSLVKK